MLTTLTTEVWTSSNCGTPIPALTRMASSGVLRGGRVLHWFRLTPGWMLTRPNARERVSARRSSHVSLATDKQVSTGRAIQKEILAICPSIPSTTKKEERPNAVARQGVNTERTNVIWKTFYRLIITLRWCRQMWSSRPLKKLKKRNRSPRKRVGRCKRHSEATP